MDIAYKILLSIIVTSFGLSLLTAGDDRLWSIFILIMVISGIALTVIYIWSL